MSAEKVFRLDGSPALVSERTLRALAETDEMPVSLRACVHEFGYPIVHACVAAGVNRPALIRQLVHEIWMGARQPQQRQGNGKSGVRSKVADHLDWLLIQAGSGISAATLLRMLWSHGMTIVPREPTNQGVTASLDAVKTMGAVSRTEKHRGRLRAAIAATARHLWPQVFE